VIACVSLILEMMPQDYPSRSKYENMYKEMATKLLKLQSGDWVWRDSLPDPKYRMLVK